MASIGSSSNVSITGGNFTINYNGNGHATAFEKLSLFVAHSALHDGPARSEGTSCLQGTRTDVLNRAQRWLEQVVEVSPPVLWLYGGAGAGKSAIMQTLSERWMPQGRAMGAFFFARTDETRNTAKALVPTLAYQLAQLYPSAMDVLGPIIISDPVVFKKSIAVQTVRLLVQPLQELIRTGFICVHPRSEKVFLIDGLDECVDSAEQDAVIKAITAVLHDYGVPIKFLVASRPEPAISTAFDVYDQRHRAMKTISLSDHKDSERDIHKFVDSQFHEIRASHLFRNSIPSNWPPHETVMALVRKSSCHFIYACIAMKYIASPKEHPVRSLDVVLGLDVARGGAPSPFPELDALYHLVLGNSVHSQKVGQILAHCIFSSLPPLVSIICLVIDCTPSDIPIFLVDVAGLVSVTKSESRLGMDTNQQRVQILHASLIDFLRDPSRSQTLYLDEKAYHSSHLETHFRLLDYYSHGEGTDPGWPLSHGEDQGYNFTPLGTQIFKSIRTSADTSLTQDVLKTYSLKRFHSIQSNFIDETEEFPSVYAGVVTYLGIIQSANISDGGRLYMTSLQQFFDIFESYLHDEMGPLAPAILPLILSRYPISTVRNIVYHFEGDRKIPYLQYTITQLLMQPCRAFRLGRISAFDNLDPEDLRAVRGTHLGPGSMAVAAAAVLEYLFSRDNSPRDLFFRTPHRTWMQRQKPGKRMATGSPVLASAFHLKCLRYKLAATVSPKSCSATRRKYLGMLSTKVAIDPKPDTLYFLLLDAVLWFLPKSDCSDRVLAYVRRVLPRTAYQRYPKLARRLQMWFDAYGARARNTKMQLLMQ
ncbi:hypothetical protein D9619_011009 [Psilocybe cf. subviscida]|uniref:Nephrocystin 3-like N-terminal domain-containing protein n=1 Tax=Psilocybe cf. subviscida TaxID=2480587 RepID=A0A8H5BAM5_9AGAR|nr:hypothetical protein D9619_011009 [Psilocybe cf. subviscida]